LLRLREREAAPAAAEVAGPPLTVPYTSRETAMSNYPDAVSGPHDFAESRVRAPRSPRPGSLHARPVDRSLAQILDSMSIPMFVIDRDHVVTHWTRPART